MRAWSKDIFGIKGRSGTSHDDGYINSSVNEKQDMLSKLMSGNLRSARCSPLDGTGRVKSYIRFREQVHSDIWSIYSTGDAS